MMAILELPGRGRKGGPAAGSDEVPGDGGLPTVVRDRGTAGVWPRAVFPPAGSAEAQPVGRCRGIPAGAIGLARQSVPWTSHGAIWEPPAAA